MAGHMKYTASEDQELMYEVVIYNPFLKGHTWEGLKKTCTSAALERRTSKSLRDRALLLMLQRNEVVKLQQKVSGIGELERSDIEVAIDHAILLKREAEEALQAYLKKKRALEDGDEEVLAAAETTLSLPSTSSISDMAGHMKYTASEDQELMDEVVIYNPFLKGHTWEGLKKASTCAALERRTSKSLRDRALLLLQQRNDVVRQQRKAFGIGEPERSDIEVAIDEAIFLKGEAEEALQASLKRKRAVEDGDEEVLTAAETPLSLPSTSSSSVWAGTQSPRATTPPLPKRRFSRELVSVLWLKLEQEKQWREEERKARKEEHEEERKLRRDELDIRRREVELNERQEEDRRKERQMLLQLVCFGLLALVAGPFQR